MNVCRRTHKSLSKNTQNSGHIKSSHLDSGVLHCVCIFRVLRKNQIWSFYADFPVEKHFYEGSALLHPFAVGVSETFVLGFFCCHESFLTLVIIVENFRHQAKESRVYLQHVVKV